MVCRKMNSGMSRDELDWFDKEDYYEKINGRCIKERWIYGRWLL